MLVGPVLLLLGLYLWLSAHAAAAARRERREVERALQRLEARQGRAARREVIEAALKLEDAPRKVYASDDCVICLDALPQAEAQPLRCGHTFHPHCIAEWCSRAGGAGGGAPRCPTCMQPISWRRALVDRALLVA